MILNSSIPTLKYGYAVLKNVIPTSFVSARASAQYYFLHPSDYKHLHQYPYNLELGYRDLIHKEMFMIRESTLPSELSPCIHLATDLHDISLQCLEAVSKELQREDHLLSDLVDVDALPSFNIASSILQLIHYRKTNNITHGIACDVHQDISLLTLICHTGVPALEIYDYLNNTDWINIESIQGMHDVIVLVGEALSLISNNYFLPATHRVRAVHQSRLAIIYQLRFKNDAVIDSQLFETSLTKPFKHPFRITGCNYLKMEKSTRQSVNGSY